MNTKRNFAGFMNIVEENVEEAPAQHDGMESVADRDTLWEGISTKAMREANRHSDSLKTIGSQSFTQKQHGHLEKEHQYGITLHKIAEKSSRDGHDKAHHAGMAAYHSVMSHFHALRAPSGEQIPFQGDKK